MMNKKDMKSMVKTAEGVKKSPEYKKVVRERTEAALKLAIEGSV